MKGAGLPDQGHKDGQHSCHRPAQGDLQQSCWVNSCFKVQPSAVECCPHPKCLPEAPVLWPFVAMHKADHQIALGGHAWIEHLLRQYQSHTAFTSSLESSARSDQP